MSALAPYPVTSAERNRWILKSRPGRNPVDPERPYAFFVEPECSASGDVLQVATIFLTNRECPWKCVMCDLWRNTTEMVVPIGAITRQITYALEQLPRAPILKLYNSGSFFDPAAIPQSEHSSIAEICNRFEHLIVECHPALITERILDFVSQLNCSCEIALGLETADPEALAKINKRITVGTFEQACGFLRRHNIAIRTFLLVQPPFIAPERQESSLQHSIEFAVNCGSSVISLIPTRAGNGALDQLKTLGQFTEPSIDQLEAAHEFGLLRHRGRFFADTWDLDRFSRCTHCFNSRRDRLARMNLAQRIEPRIHCRHCHV